MLRGLLLVAVGSSCGVALIACGLFTSLDDLAGSPAVDDANTEDRSVPLDGGGTVDVTADAATDAWMPVVYLPPAGNYRYVQNAAAYAGGMDFEASVGDLGYDLLTLTTLNQIYRRKQADTMPASVRYVDGGLGECWTLVIQVLPTDGKEAHVEQQTFCARDGGLFDPGIDSSEQLQMWNVGGAFGVQSSTAKLNCDPRDAFLFAALSPDASHSCVGTAEMTNSNYISAGPYSLIGLEKVTTQDGVTEAAFHTLLMRTVSGSSTNGTETTDFYLSARDGLPLRIHRHIHIATQVPFSSALYDEHGSDWLLFSHTPQ